MLIEHLLRLQTRPDNKDVIQLLAFNHTQNSLTEITTLI